MHELDRLIELLEINGFDFVKGIYIDKETFQELLLIDFENLHTNKNSLEYKGYKISQK